MKSLITLLMVLVSATALGDAERQWKGKCAPCHGKDGKAQTEKGKKMKIVDMTSPEFKKKTDAELRKAITEGVDNGDKQMDPYKEELTPEQVDDLVKFIRSL